MKPNYGPAPIYEKALEHTSLSLRESDVELLKKIGEDRGVSGGLRFVIDDLMRRNDLPVEELARMESDFD